jgi:hypothetical protein
VLEMQPKQVEQNSSGVIRTHELFDASASAPPKLSPLNSLFKSCAFVIRLASVNALFTA